MRRSTLALTVPFRLAAQAQPSFLDYLSRLMIEPRAVEAAIWRATIVAIACLLGAAPALVQEAVPVTVDNFIRAESDTYLANFAKENEGLGKLVHRREPAAIDNQTVIRLNRDTLYSSAVFDFDAGPVAVTLPDAGNRFMSLMTVSQDHYATTVYGKGAHRITRDNIGTRYGLVCIRTFVDPNDPEDVKKVEGAETVHAQHA